MCCRMSEVRRQFESKCSLFYHVNSSDKKIKKILRLGVKTVRPRSCLVCLGVMLSSNGMLKVWQVVTFVIILDKIAPLILLVEFSELSLVAEMKWPCEMIYVKDVLWG